MVLPETEMRSMIEEIDAMTAIAIMIAVAKREAGRRAIREIIDAVRTEIERENETAGVGEMNIGMGAVVTGIEIIGREMMRGRIREMVIGEMCRIELEVSLCQMRIRRRCLR